jgi:hypothetical protein
VALTTSQCTVMQAHFSLFLGLSIQLYLSTLVSDDTPFDQFLGGQAGALTTQQQAGMDLFLGKAGCARGHVGSELTEASYGECYQERFDTLTSLTSVETKYDKGFVNTGVRAIGDDTGIGGTDPYGYRLAASRRLQMGLLPAGTYNLDIGPQDAIAIDGAFKIPGLRNVELTAPYFHNGGMATLEFDPGRCFQRRLARISVRSLLVTGPPVPGAPESANHPCHCSRSDCPGSSGLCAVPPGPQFPADRSFSAMARHPGLPTACHGILCRVLCGISWSLLRVLFCRRARAASAPRSNSLDEWPLDMRTRLLRTPQSVL